LAEAAAQVPQLVAVAELVGLLFAQACLLRVLIPRLLALEETVQSLTVEAVQTVETLHLTLLPLLAVVEGRTMALALQEVLAVELGTTTETLEEPQHKEILAEELVMGLLEEVTLEQALAHLTLVAEAAELAE
jgi:hypothetical protein